MSLPAFDADWREKQRIKPRVCLLVVRDKKKPDGKAITRLFVERQENYRHDESGRIYEASISLSYEIIEPKHLRRSRESGSFCGSYLRGYRENESVSLVGSALFFDPSELRGQRIGTYLMSEIVTWAQQWPEATVRPIKLLSGQAEEENRARRNRFYERFGLEFMYSDPEHREGVSKSMPVANLIPVTSWEINISEHDPREYLAELLYERERMVMDSSQRVDAIKRLSARLDDAQLHPIRWAIRQLWWRIARTLFQGAILITLGTAIWAGFRLQ